MAAVEILKINNAVANLVRTAQFSQIYNILETSSSQGMQGFDTALANLCFEGLLDEKMALTVVRNEKLFIDKLNLLINPPQEELEVEPEPSGFFQRKKR